MLVKHQADKKTLVHAVIAILNNPRILSFWGVALGQRDEQKVKERKENAHNIRLQALSDYFKNTIESDAHLHHTSSRLRFGENTIKYIEARPAKSKAKNNNVVTPSPASTGHRSYGSSAMATKRKSLVCVLDESNRLLKRPRSEDANGVPTPARLINDPIRKDPMESDMNADYDDKDFGMQIDDDDPTDKNSIENTSPTADRPSVSKVHPIDNDPSGAGGNGLGATSINGPTLDPSTAIQNDPIGKGPSETAGKATSRIEKPLGATKVVHEASKKGPSETANKENQAPTKKAPVTTNNNTDSA